MEAMRGSPDLVPGEDQRLTRQKKSPREQAPIIRLGDGLAALTEVCLKHKPSK